MLPPPTPALGIQVSERTLTQISNASFLSASNASGPMLPPSPRSHLDPSKWSLNQTDSATDVTDSPSGAERTEYDPGYKKELKLALLKQVLSDSNFTSFFSGGGDEFSSLPEPQKVMLTAAFTANSTPDFGDALVDFNFKYLDSGSLNIGMYNMLDQARLISASGKPTTVRINDTALNEDFHQMDDIVVAIAIAERTFNNGREKVQEALDKNSKLTTLHSRGYYAWISALLGPGHGQVSTITSVLESNLFTSEELNQAKDFAVNSRSPLNSAEALWIASNRGLLNIEIIRKLPLPEPDRLQFKGDDQSFVKQSLMAYSILIRQDAGESELIDKKLLVALENLADDSVFLNNVLIDISAHSGNEAMQAEILSGLPELTEYQRMSKEGRSYYTGLKSALIDTEKSDLIKQIRPLLAEQYFDSEELVQAQEFTKIDGFNSNEEAWSASVRALLKIKKIRDSQPTALKPFNAPDDSLRFVKQSLAAFSASDQQLHDALKDLGEEQAFFLNSTLRDVMRQSDGKIRKHILSDLKAYSAALKDPSFTSKLKALYKETRPSHALAAKLYLADNRLLGDSGVDFAAFWEGGSPEQRMLVDDVLKHPAFKKAMKNGLTSVEALTALHSATKSVNWQKQFSELPVWAQPKSDFGLFTFFHEVGQNSTNAQAIMHGELNAAASVEQLPKPPGAKSDLPLEGVYEQEMIDGFEHFGLLQTPPNTTRIIDIVGEPGPRRNHAILVTRESQWTRGNGGLRPGSIMEPRTGEFNVGSISANFRHFNDMLDIRNGKGNIDSLKKIIEAKYAFLIYSWAYTLSELQMKYAPQEPTIIDLNFSQGTYVKSHIVAPVYYALESADEVSPPSPLITELKTNLGVNLTDPLPEDQTIAFLQAIVDDLFKAAGNKNQTQAALDAPALHVAFDGYISTLNNLINDTHNPVAFMVSAGNRGAPGPDFDRSVEIFPNNMADKLLPGADIFEVASFHFGRNTSDIRIASYSNTGLLAAHGQSAKNGPDHTEDVTQGTSFASPEALAVRTMVLEQLLAGAKNSEIPLNEYIPQTVQLANLFLIEAATDIPGTSKDGAGAMAPLVSPLAAKRFAESHLKGATIADYLEKLTQKHLDDAAKNGNTITRDTAETRAQADYEKDRKQAIAGAEKEVNDWKMKSAAAPGRRGLKSAMLQPPKITPKLINLVKDATSHENFAEFYAGGRWRYLPDSHQVLLSAAFIAEPGRRDGTDLQRQLMHADEASVITALNKIAENPPHQNALQEASPERVQDGQGQINDLRREDIDHLAAVGANMEAAVRRGQGTQLQEYMQNLPNDLGARRLFSHLYGNVEPGLLQQMQSLLSESAFSDSRIQSALQTASSLEADGRFSPSQIWTTVSQGLMNVHWVQRTTQDMQNSPGQHNSEADDAVVDNLMTSQSSDDFLRRSLAAIWVQLHPHRPVNRLVEDLSNLSEEHLMEAAELVMRPNADRWDQHYILTSISELNYAMDQNLSKHLGPSAQDWSAQDLLLAAGLYHSSVTEQTTDANPGVLSPRVRGLILESGSRGSRSITDDRNLVQVAHSSQLTPRSRESEVVNRLTRRDG